MEKTNITEWEQTYYKKEFIDLKKYLTKKDIETLKKLDIIIKEKIYTEHEYEVLKCSLLMYYTDKTESKEERKYKKSLKEKKVTQNEFSNLLKKINDIGDIYNI